MPWSRLNSSATQSMMRWSKSSPPRKVSPLVDLTSKTPSPTSSGDVEGAAAQVVDGDGLILLLVQTIGQRRSGRLVDDAQDFQAGDAAGVLGGLALRVVEVGRHGDDGLGDGLAEVASASALILARIMALTSGGSTPCRPCGRARRRWGRR